MVFICSLGRHRFRPNVISRRGIRRRLTGLLARGPGSLLTEFVPRSGLFPSAADCAGFEPPECRAFCLSHFREAMVCNLQPMPLDRHLFVIRLNSARVLMTGLRVHLQTPHDRLECELMKYRGKRDLSFFDVSVPVGNSEPYFLDGYLPGRPTSSRYWWVNESIRFKTSVQKELNLPDLLSIQFTAMI
jgi:hypothetical protein